ncbi:hypothetical protein GCM10011430_14470 [Oxalicibacterium solurbis]|uniref:Uncharacterized protein n=1 Tax=Oxalicibacterium solurbis TaxID=69280 RepID=A0A8J3F952_9BURK|nr:hypothetical protein GCM10011430_14470 [Oxalicibacterium solurbis]
MYFAARSNLERDITDANAIGNTRTLFGVEKAGVDGSNMGWQRARARRDRAAAPAGNECSWNDRLNMFS